MINKIAGASGLNKTKYYNGSTKNVDNYYEHNDEERMYSAIFKCQLCGKEFVGFKVHQVTDADIRNSEKRKHSCSDGGVGIAVLAGFRITRSNFELEC